MGRVTTTPATVLGANVRAAREAVGWNLAQLARAAGVVPSQISDLEAGRIKDSRASVLYRIALALGVTMESLMGVQDLHRTTKANVRRRNASLSAGPETTDVLTSSDFGSCASDRKPS
jgi:transcriptional regulator with XRE-family HTH domain